MVLHKSKHLRFLINSILKFGNKVLIENLKNGKKTTYEDFYNKSINFCNYLKFKKKLKRSDKIIIKLENSEEYLVSVFACFIGGFVACPIDQEISKTKYSNLKKIINPSLEILNFKDIKYLQIKKKLGIGGNQISIIIFTSGTTGEPKGIQIKTNSYLGSAKSFGNLCEYNADTKIYHCLPMNYNAGLLNTFFSALFYGSEIVLGPKIDSLNILNFWTNILDKNITSVHMIPEIANALCRLNVSLKERECAKKIEKIICTGSYLYESTKDNFEKKFQKRLLSCYGLTEVGGPITLQKWEDSFEENSVGQKLKEVKIKIFRKKKLNHILVKTPYLFESYLLSKDKINKPDLNNGYFNTGDVGYIKDNQLFVTGRRKDIFKKGSEIISPQEIKNVCLKSKLIKDCCVIEKSDLNKGAKIYILVEFSNFKDPILNINKLNKFLIKNLKKIEIPDKIIPVPKILKTYNGKIKKFEMEKIYL